MMLLTGSKEAKTLDFYRNAGYNGLDKTAFIQWIDTIQLILKELNNTTLLYALAGASGKVCRRFLENLSGRMMFFLNQYIWQEDFSLEEIEIAQRAVMKIYSIVKQ